jgi:hypothetical protein
MVVVRAARNMHKNQDNHSLGSMIISIEGLNCHAQ